MPPAMLSTSDIGPRERTLHSSPSSDVYVASCTTGGQPMPIVVKRTKITGPNDMKRFDKELELLTACTHEFIVAPVGVLRAPPTYALVLPVFARGSLFASLHASGRTLTAHAKLRTSRDIAAAIAHLHERGILHRDIKSDNVLLDASGQAVLTDFNAAEWEANVTSDIVMQARPTGGFFKQFVVGTLPYMAPELLRSVRGAKYTCSCDVYSLGITINEVLTQTVPYSDAMTEQVQLHTILEARYNHEALTAAITADGIRPAQEMKLKTEESRSQLEELSRLAASCWADAAAMRPAVSDVASRIGALLEAAGGASSEFFCDADDAHRNTGAAADTAAGMAPGVTAASVDYAMEDAAPVESLSASVASDADLMRGLSTALGVASQRPPRIGWEASAGRRGADRMEDRTVALSTNGVALAAVFDGHNGDAAAEWCRKHIVRCLHSRMIAQPKAGAADALRHVFTDLHEGFVRSTGADDSGCTALAALSTADDVLVANAGDCRCVLWRVDAHGEQQLVELNEEHTSDLPAERARVEAAGATISKTMDGKLRVGGIIQVTRCIGDAPLRHLGLISEPSMRHVQVTAEDKALVLASDGLWDVMPHARVLHCLQHTAKSPDLIAKRLLQEALDRGTNDNTSVVVVFLQELGPGAVATSDSRNEN